MRRIYGALFAIVIAVQPGAAFADKVVSLKLPELQHKFVKLNEEYKKPYEDAQNELKKSSVAKEKKNAIRELIKDGKFVDWYGVIENLGTTREGNAFISIYLEGVAFKIATWNNEFSDIQHKTLINNGSALYEKLSEMKVGSLVRVSGSFKKEGNATERGQMLDPVYIVKFSSIDIVNTDTLKK